MNNSGVLKYQNKYLSLWKIHSENYRKVQTAALKAQQTQLLIIHKTDRVI